jgi:hypothetical protein
MGAGKGRGVGERFGDLPRGTVNGFRDHYGHKGFTEGTELESDEGQFMSFWKRTPDGKRVHIKIFRGSKYYTIDRHVDRADPAVNPFGHVPDILFSPEHTRQRVRRRDVS